jgi:uncharacterized protein (TIGR00159 family)
MSLNLLGNPVFSFFWLTQLIDVLLLTLILWLLLRAIWNQPAKRVIIPVGLFIILAMALQRLHLHATGRLLEEAAKILPLALIIIFHEEIKNILGKFGRKLQEMGFLNRNKPGQRQDIFLENLVATCSRLSARRMGALFVIQGNEEVANFCKDYHTLPGIEFVPILVEAMLTSPGPLHDGAIVVTREGKILMAHAFLPMQLGVTGFGGRHRAGLGISGRTDAIAVLVSEETGACRLAIRGELSDSLSDSAIRRRLYKQFFQT